MTLPDPDVLELLRERFVLGHRNIEKEDHVGLSHGYKPTQCAVRTTNGAGGRNVQFLVLAADETVLHALPGFWHAEDLIPELQLALEIDRLYHAPRISAGAKKKMFELLHETHLRRYGKAAERRGRWQSFDRRFELMRAQTEPRDTIATSGGSGAKLKTIPRLVHDRLLQRRFAKLEDFDLESFVDYGRPFYDNNHGDKGRSFRGAERNERRRQKQLAKDAKVRERAAKKSRANGEPVERDGRWGARD